MVSELVGRIAEARLWLSTLGGSDAFAVEQMLSEIGLSIEALESDCRMKDELLTAAVGDYNDALKALEPFANAAELVPQYADNDAAGISVGALRRARSFIRSRTTEGENG